MDFFNPIEIFFYFIWSQTGIPIGAVGDAVNGGKDLTAKAKEAHGKIIKNA